MGAAFDGKLNLNSRRNDNAMCGGTRSVFLECVPGYNARVAEALILGTRIQGGSNAVDDTEVLEELSNHTKSK